MLTPRGDIKLKTGEIVSAAVVLGPDLEWASRVEPLLGHKGDPWNWQNSELLKRDTGIAAQFYLLHRGGLPFSNIMLAESAGVALLGHVWTEPSDRGAGASKSLMDLLLERFRRSDCRAIFLGAEPEGEPFRYYARRGFVPVEEGSGYMVLTKGDRMDFAAAWYREMPGRVEPLDWRHWPAAAPLCLGDFPGMVRLAATGLIGLASSETPFLPVLREQTRRRTGHERDCAFVLTNRAGAVLGFACRMSDPLRPEQDVLDVYCHPRSWPAAGKLVDPLASWTGRACVAYAEPSAVEKNAVLRAAGFSAGPVLPGWIKGLAARRAGAEVCLWEKPA